MTNEELLGKLRPFDEITGGELSGQITKDGYNLIFEVLKGEVTGNQWERRDDLLAILVKIDFLVVCHWRFGLQRNEPFGPAKVKLETKKGTIEGECWIDVVNVEQHFTTIRGSIEYRIALQTHNQEDK